MTSVVAVWTGREVRALRVARRMSLREFARHLGVSDRMISKWEAGGAGIQPRPVNQEALDSSLGTCSDQEQARFALLLADVLDRAALDLARPVVAQGWADLEVAYDAGDADETVIEVAWPAAQVGILPTGVAPPADLAAWDLRVPEQWSVDHLVHALERGAS